MKKVFKKITDLETIRGKRVLLRVDFNVTIKNGKILDDYRIMKALPTIEYLKKKGAKVILISHLGEKGESLALVSKQLKKYISHTFIANMDGERAYMALNTMKNGDIILLENLRQNPGEMKNDPKFAKALASLADIYVNDAFPVSHRAHASIVGVPKLLPSYAGMQLVQEVNALSHVMDKPKKPFLFILGGAKFDTKIPLIKKYLSLADCVFIGGALANNFFKEEGLQIGKSLVDKGRFGLEVLSGHGNLFTPLDVIVTKGTLRQGLRLSSAERPQGRARVAIPEEVAKDETIVDIGPMSVDLIAMLIAQSKTVLWNGPMGKYEEGFGGATETILKLLAKSPAMTIIGGGDTVTIASKLKIEDKLTFVSTGGGSTVEYLAKGALPGIDALSRG